MNETSQSDRFRIGARVLCGGRYGTVTAAETFAGRVPVRWDDGTEGIPLAGDLEIVEPGWGVR